MLLEVRSKSGPSLANSASVSFPFLSFHMSAPEDACHEAIMEVALRHLQ